MKRFLKLFKRNFGSSKVTFNLENIKVDISDEHNGIRLITVDENWFIPRQTLDETKMIIEKNFKIIKNFFQEKVKTVITDSDLNNVCLKITLNYFQMYNHWRTMYKREANRDLTFIQKDFDTPDTTNIVIGYFKSKYAADFEDKCIAMLEMTREKLKESVTRKEQYENM